MPSPEESKVYRKIGRETDAHVYYAARDIGREERGVRQGQIDTVSAEFKRRMNRQHVHIQHHGIYAVQIRDISATLGPYNARTHTYALKGTDRRMPRISVNQLHRELFGETGLGLNCDSQCTEILNGTK